MSRLVPYLLVFTVAVGGIGYFIYKEGAHIEERDAAAVESALSDAGNFHFEVVSTDAARERGLGGRTDVPHAYGMLFVFPTDGRYGFWMKDMLVPIDIIWLSDNGTVLSILDSVSPHTYPTVFYPPIPVRYVLETRAGEARAQDWHEGTILALPL